MIPRFALVPAVFAALLGAAVAAQPCRGWRLYKSASERFAAYYPPGFHMLNPRLFGLDVVNVPRSRLASGGPVIPENGAEITVGPAEQPGKTIDDLIVQSQRSADGPPILEQTLLTSGLGPDGCPALHQVENYENFGGPIHPVLMHWTTYFCEVHGRIFAVTLSYWRGNKDRKMLEGFARTVAMTLRIYK